MRERRTGYTAGPRLAVGLGTPRSPGVRGTAQARPGGQTEGVAACRRRLVMSSTPWGRPASPGRRRSWLAAGSAATARLLALYALLLAGAGLLLALFTPLAVSGVVIARLLGGFPQAAAFSVKPGGPPVLVQQGFTGGHLF